ncbi:MAG: hypothetical protein ACI4P5_11535 [Candidatus Fimadaptatus sp.]
MPDTRITREKLKNHWMYSSWKYLLMAVIFIAGWNLTYSVTEYRPPREKRLEMYVLSTAYNDEGLRALQEELAPEFVGLEEGDMEAFTIFTMNYGEEGDTYGPQVLMTRLASWEGDVYLVNEETLTSFIVQELALPLDEYIADGTLNVDGYDLETATRAEPAGEDDEGNVIYSGVRHVYALPAQPMYGLLDEGLVDNRGMYFVVMSYTDKAEKCMELLNVLSARFVEDKPEWLIAQEEQKRREIAELPTELTVDSLKAQATAAPTEEPAGDAQAQATAAPTPETQE